MADLRADPAPTRGWEPEPLHLPLELPHTPPEEPAGPTSEDDDEAGGRVIVLDIS